MSQEEWRNGGTEILLSRNTTKIHEALLAVRLAAGACRDVREDTYNPSFDRWLRLVFAFSYVPAVGVLRTPTNRTAGIPVRPPLLRFSCESVFFVILITRAIFAGFAVIRP